MISGHDAMKYLLLLLLPLTGLLTNSLAAVDSTVKKTNIIIILADDLGYSDLGCYGSEIATPNLDRLASNGLRFTRFFNSGKCEPTRASLMSGQYWQDCGLGVKNGLTMGQAMKTAGYDTFAIGKWHMDGNPVERGFDHYFGHLSGASDYFKGNSSHHLDDKAFKPKPDEKFYTTDANADYAIKFISEAQQKQPDKPFFMYLAFNAPHAPIQAWPEDIVKYRGKYRIGWDKLREQRYQKQIATGIMQPAWVMSPRPETIPAWDTLSAEEQDFEDLRMSIYAAMIDRMDQAIGRILAQVKAMGEEDNTLVMFLSDNGASPYDHTKKRSVDSVMTGGWEYGLGWANVSETPFRHFKRNMSNGGACTPCIAYWPAVVKAPGTITDQSAHIIDLMATIVDVGGVQWPTTFAGKEVKALAGKSLRPIFFGEQRVPHEALFFQLFDHRAVIVGDYKLVSDWGRPWELFNEKVDRTELQDLTKAEPEQAVKLQKLWDEWASSTNIKLRSAGGEPVYRRLADAEEKFIGGSGEADEEGEEKKPKKKK